MKKRIRGGTVIIFLVAAALAQGVVGGVHAVIYLWHKHTIEVPIGADETKMGEFNGKDIDG